MPPSDHIAASGSDAPLTHRRAAPGVFGGLGTEQKVLGGFVFALCCLGVIGVVSFTALSHLQRDAREVKQADEVIATLRAVLAATSAVESAQRGYTVWPEPGFVTSFERERVRAEQEMAVLGALVRSSVEQVERWHALQPLVARRLAISREIIELRRDQTFAAAQAATATGEGRAVHENVRQILDQMEAAERQSLQLFENNAKRSGRTAQAVILGGSGVGLTFVALALLAIRRDFAGRQQSDQALREARDELESRVQVRTAELARANDELRVSEARLAAIVDSAMDAIVSIDAQQRVVLFNAGAEKMFRCAAGTAIGKSIDRFIPERFRQRVHDRIRGDARRASEQWTVDSLFGLRADGEEFPVDASVSRIGVGGQAVVTVILRDITERRRAEAVTARLAAIVESSDDAIVGKDLEGIVTSWNAGAERIYGYTANEMIGQSIRRLIPPERQAEEDEISATIRQGGRREPFETVRRRKAGTAIEISVRVSAVRDAAGTVNSRATSPSGSRASAACTRRTGAWRKSCTG